MAGPWEDYQKAAPVAQAPWLDYAAPAPSDAIPGARVEQEPMAWRDVGKGFARNIIPSTGRLLKGTAEAILSPIDTASALGALAKSEYLLTTGQGTPDELAAAQAFNNMYKQRYGSAEGFKQALATDPASVLADVSTVLAGGAGILGKLGAPAKVTGALSTAASATNPLTLGPVTMLPPVRALGGGIASKAAEYLLPEALGGGKALLENRAFRAALGDDPALMQQASNLLKQGKTIQEVAVELNSPSLAAFAKNAESVFGAKSTDVGAIQRQFAQQQAARQQTLANQIAAAQQGVQGLQAPINQFAAQAGVTPEQAVNALRVQTPETVGEAIRTSALSAQKAAKKPIQARAEAAIEAARGTQVYSQKLGAVAREIGADEFAQLINAAPRTSDILRKASPQPIKGGLMGVKQVGDTLPTMSLGELDALRRAINSDLASVERAAATGASSTAATSRANLLKLKTAVDDLIATSPTLASGAAQEYMGAMRQFGTEYAPAFRSETARQLLGTKYGAPALKPEDVVKKYFSPGSVTEPTEFLRMAQYDPSLLDTMRTGIESTFRNAVTDATGAIAPTKAAKFLQTYEAPLRVLEAGGVDTSTVRNAAQQIGSAQELGSQAATKLAELAPLQKRLDALQSKIGTEGTATLKTPESASEIASIAEDVSKKLNIEETFKELAAKGRGLGVKTLEAPEAIKMPIGIKTEIIINGIKKLMGMSINDELAKRIALKVLDNKETAAALDRAYQARQVGKTVSTEISRAVKVAPGVMNALSGARNENALSR